MINMTHKERMKQLLYLRLAIAVIALTFVAVPVVIYLKSISQTC